MPSGITSDLYEGKDTSLRGYLMSVGRSMGYAIMQRDDDRAEPVREVTASDYSRRQADTLRRELAELEGLSVAEAWTRCQAERAAAVERRDEHVRERRELRVRYERMLAQVGAWHPDPLVASTKEYALKHLQESIDFDCDAPGEEARYWPRPPVYLDGSEYITERRKQLQTEIDRAEQNQREEDERTADRNRHIAAFLGSLPAAPSDGPDGEG